MTSIIFFGSFQHYSTKVLKALHQAPGVDIVGVVTTPPQSSQTRRQKQLIKTDIHQYADHHHLPLFTPEKLTRKSPSELSISPPDFLVVAGYGKLLPKEWLDYPKVAPLNLHFSLLPNYRGANPAEWAILMGEKQTGVTLIKMTDKLDQGPILAQEKTNISPPDTRQTLYQKLYDLAAKLIVKILSSPSLILNSAKAQPAQSPTPYARRLRRDDGFIPWNLIQLATQGKNLPPSKRPGIFSLVTDHWPLVVERSVRALHGYPGIWTKVKTTKGTKRLKLLSAHLQAHQLVLDQVQLEGLQPSSFNQIKNQISNLT
jgi:methionyl-tRNA formyltransferase